MQGHINYVGERGGSVVDCRTPEREVGVRNLLEQDTIYSSKELALFSILHNAMVNEEM